MTKAKTVGAVERERERTTLYSTWNSSTRPHTSSFIEIKEGGNTFICDKKRQTRLK